MEPQKSRPKTRFNLKVFILFALSGITLISYGSYLKYRSLILSFNKTPQVYEIKKERLSVPTFIKIEKAGIELPIESFQIVNGVWQVSDASASFLESSARPGEGGNIVIYGHNKRKIFGKLIGRKLIGEKIEIVTQDNNSQFYKIENIKIVEPSEISLVSPTDYEVLTIYTCTGLLDSKRLVIKAFPVSDIN